MKPAIFSIQKGSGWVRGGSNIKYLKSRILKEDSTTDACYYSLSFSLKFKFENDLVYIAMNIPYSYTQMINHID